MTICKYCDGTGFSYGNIPCVCQENVVKKSLVQNDLDKNNNKFTFNFGDVDWSYFEKEFKRIFGNPAKIKTLEKSSAYTYCPIYGTNGIAIIRADCPVVIGDEVFVDDIFVGYALDKSNDNNMVRVALNWYLE